MMRAWTCLQLTARPSNSVSYRVRDYHACRVTRGRVRSKAEQDPYAEVETVEQHIEENPETEDQRPDQDEIESERQRGHCVVPPGRKAGSSVTGWPGRPLSTASSSAIIASGPRRTMRDITIQPAGKMMA